MSSFELPLWYWNGVLSPQNLVRLSPSMIPESMSLRKYGDKAMDPLKHTGKKNKQTNKYKTFTCPKSKQICQDRAFSEHCTHHFHHQYRLLPPTVLIINKQIFLQICSCVHLLVAVKVEHVPKSSGRHTKTQISGPYH